MVYRLALYTQQRRPILHDLLFARLRRITIGSILRVFDRRLYSITIIYDDDDIVRDFHRRRLSNDASTYSDYRIENRYACVKNILEKYLRIT